MRVFLSVFLVASLAACSDQGPRTVREVRVTGGDRQVARVGTVLPEPVTVTVQDESGHPLRGERVEWHADGGGLLSPLNTVTDESGVSRARWILGSEEGLRTATASLGGAEPAVITAVAESPDALPFDQPQVLTISTFDGSGQVVHPDYAGTPAGRFGTAGHLAITPYFQGDARFENPSLFAGKRPDTWLLEAGAPNPVVIPQSGYLSDPDLLYEPDAKELWLYYRQVSGANLVHLLRSPDGITWRPAVEVARAPSHNLVSPSIVRRGAGDWWMWSVNSGPSGCGASSTVVEVRRSTDGIVWSDPQMTDLTGGDLWPWHIDVEWIPDLEQFWAVYNVKTSTECTTPAVFLATSADGVTWQRVERPVIVKGLIPEFRDIVYRASFAYDPLTDAVTFWYSGARFLSGSYVWRAAVERRHRSDLFSNLASVQGRLMFTPAPAPLIDWP
ncbi:MAG: hypothetical protein ACREL3_08435 [Gemmatimonadales bacterium]